MTMKYEDVVKVWNTAKNPVGYSIHKLSGLTELETAEVERIILRLSELNLVQVRYRGGFNGWVSQGTEREIARMMEVKKD